MKDEHFEALEYIERRARVAAAARDAGLPVRDYLARRRKIQAAKEMAAASGLAYWPAIAYGPRIDPWAYVIAERVMLRTLEVEPWNPPHSYGGWDSKGFRGLSPSEVAAIWYASGCRDSRKFRAAVECAVMHAWVPPPKKCESEHEYRAFARAWAWMHGRTRRLSRKAVAALGRLSTDLRLAALKGVYLSSDRPVRVRHLNWAEVRRIQQMLISAPEERLPALRAALRQKVYYAARVLEVRLERQIVERLTPAYPYVPFEVARRLVLGESPQSISGDILSRREAHEWLLAGAPDDLAGWFCRSHDLPSVRSMRVARWLLAVRESGRWDALTREREAVRRGGQQVAFRAIDVLDEIADEDIITGRDSVKAVLRRSAVRLGEAYLTEEAKDHRILAPLPKWAEKMPRWIRLLRTPAALATEGLEMNHCVGGYASAVEQGQCHILAIASRHGRSTVELSPTLEVRQHRGPRNAEPPARHKALLRAWLRRVAKHRNA